MNDGTIAAEASGRDETKWSRPGGIAAILLGLGYVATFPLYFRVGAPPASGDAWFRYLPGKTDVWWVIVALSVFTDFLYIPVILALYSCLKRCAKNAMLLATTFVLAFVFLDLAVTWPHYASILTLYQNYAATNDAAGRAAAIAAADYGCAVLNSPLEIVYSIVTLSVAILVIGWAMLGTAFGRVTAVLGLITGVLGIACLSRLSFAILGNAIGATVWLFLVGFGLWRQAGRR